MAINQNHTFEELNGVKCGIVEKNVTPERLDFLRGILEYNHYSVVTAPSPPPKTAAPAAGASASASAAEALGGVASGGVASAGTAASGVATPPPVPETFTVGVTDVTFNPVNAIFGRLLRTPKGHVVTLAYWQQKDKESNDAIPYFAER
jgi:hypothetical protein